MKVVVPCPAKVNLFLAVGPRDSRGYHPIRTVFQAVSLFDTLTIESSDHTEFVCDWPGMPKDNTVVKAMRLLSEVVRLPKVRVVLQKRIPDKSGLGGGSSDAAGFLRGAMAFVKAKPTEAELRDIAFAIGADVPFFLVGGRARGEGYGEVVTPLEDPPEQWMLIVRPPVDCPTGPAYSRLDELEYPWMDWGGSDELYNDFERVMPTECLLAKHRLLGLGAQGALLTGSGSAVLGLFPSKQSALRAKRSVENCKDPFSAWVVKSITGKESLRLA